MKWGRRRYQNKDGSLTPEGKEHYKEMYKAANKAGKYSSYKGIQGAGQHLAKKSKEIQAAGERLAGLKYSKQQAANDMSKKQNKLDKFVDKKYSKMFGNNRRQDAEDDWGTYKDRMGMLKLKYSDKKVVKNERESVERYRNIRDLFDSEATKIANEMLGEYADKPIKTLAATQGNYRTARDVVKAALEESAHVYLKTTKNDYGEYLTGVRDIEHL